MTSGFLIRLIRSQQVECRTVVPDLREGYSLNYTFNNVQGSEKKLSSLQGTAGSM